MHLLHREKEKLHHYELSSDERTRHPRRMIISVFIWLRTAFLHQLPCGRCLWSFPMWRLFSASLMHGSLRYHWLSRTSESCWMLPEFPSIASDSREDALIASVIRTEASLYVLSTLCSFTCVPPLSCSYPTPCVFTLLSPPPLSTLVSRGPLSFSSPLFLMCSACFATRQGFAILSSTTLYAHKLWFVFSASKGDGGENTVI